MHLLIIWFLLQECKIHEGVDCVLSLYPKCLEESVAHNRCSLDICWINELLLKTTKNVIVSYCWNMWRLRLNSCMCMCACVYVCLEWKQSRNRWAWGFSAVYRQNTDFLFSKQLELVTAIFGTLFWLMSTKTKTKTEKKREKEVVYMQDCSTYKKMYSDLE